VDHLASRRGLQFEKHCSSSSMSENTLQTRPCLYHIFHELGNPYYAQLLLELIVATAGTEFIVGTDCFITVCPGAVCWNAVLQQRELRSLLGQIVAVGVDVIVSSQYCITWQQ
jgi:hypothetical protein